MEALEDSAVLSVLFTIHPKVNKRNLRALSILAAKFISLSFDEARIVSFRYSLGFLLKSQVAVVRNLESTEEVVKRMIMLLHTFQAGRTQAHLWHSDYS